MPDFRLRKVGVEFLDLNLVATFRLREEFAGLLEENLL